MPDITLTICNKKGLHARAAAKFVKTVGACDAEVRVIKQGESAEVPGGSILGLMMLGAECGSRLHIAADGNDAEKVLNELKALIENKFGEGE